MIQPTIGRVVWYRPNAFDGLVTGGSRAEPQALPALVCCVHNERMINIAGFDANGVPFARTSVHLRQEGDEQPAGSYAEWMPYQIGQAKKAE